MSVPSRCLQTPHRLASAFALLVLLSSSLTADPPVDFNRQIRPLLSNHCLVCHGPDENERASGLRLDTQDGAGMDLGGYAAIVPGDPDASELMVRLTTDDDDLRMPPVGKGPSLSDEEIELLRRWIEQGASYARHWSYETPVQPELPAISQTTWPRNPIDHFILAKLEANGLQPSAEADRWTLARRVAIDLTGLPPTWEEAAAFHDDTHENAYELFVDRLLAKQSFGERWARVWLDLARYADSAGYADDPPRTIWAYRDYVIRSLNENKPFDQFTIEQIAGDLLEDPSEEQLVATAFHRNTLTNNEGGTNDEEFRNVAVVDRVNTTMAVWMGTTMACAQCHTHKYDPITQDEYFQFFALFNNTADADKRDEQPLLELWSDAQESQKTRLRERIAELKTVLKTSTPELVAAQQDWLGRLRSEPDWVPLVPQATSAESRELQFDDQGWITAKGEKTDHEDYLLSYATGDMRMSGLRLEVPADQKTNFVLSRVKASWTPAGKQAIETRYVRVDLPGKGKMIHLAELQVFSDGDNIALDGTATQSSTDFAGKVQYVNDGNTDGDYGNKSVSHTAIENDPWLEIDLGAMKPVDRVTIWNRTDGGDAIADRLKGFRLSLLDEERNVLWQQLPEDVPRPSDMFSPGGTIDIPFSAALADHEQQGFPADSVLAAPENSKPGWAVAPQQAEPHELTLIPQEPITLSDGVLTVHLEQTSEHKRQLLNRFRLAITSNPNVAEWAKMPTSIRDIVRKQNEPIDEEQEQSLAEYYRGITPLLAPQRTQLEKAEKQLASMKPYTTVPVMRQLPDDKQRETHVQIRGNYQSKGVAVSAGTPAAFHPLRADMRRDRLALAEWLIDDANPLTARVIANRHWEEIFGIGIVATSEEFGSQGDLPSHPLLLDWLAVELRESGWDLKRLLKLLVTSATYRQSSRMTESLQQTDPSNLLYARGPRFRISAEMVRDQTLFVSGLLSDKMYGSPVNPPQPELGLKAAFGSATDWKTSDGGDRYRRGIYTMWRRSSPYPSMAQFDAPNREVCTVRRIRTNTPLQALVTLNDPVYVEAAQSLARSMMAAGETPKSRIRFAIRQCLIREPHDGEIERLTRLAANASEYYLAHPEEAMPMATEPLGDLPEGTDTAEAAAWTVVGNVILNLDEMFMKR